MQNYRHEFIAPNEKWDILLEFMIDPGGSVINKHFHDWIEIVYLIHGDLEFQENNRSRQLKENEFMVVNPMSIHSTRCVDGNTAILLQIPMSFLEKFFPDIREYRFQVDWDSADRKVRTKLREMRSTLQDIWITYQFQEEGYIFRCYSLIFEFIYILIHSFSYKADRKELIQTQKNMERIQVIMDYVQQHYCEPVSIKEIAGEVGLNEIYFSRFFKTNMNLTFMEYLNMVRLEKIHMDLLNTDRSIRNIQEEHGFYNDKVFRRMFREVYGCSPRDARNHTKRCRNEDTKEEKEGFSGLYRKCEGK